VESGKGSPHVDLSARVLAESQHEGSVRDATMGRSSCSAASPNYTYWIRVEAWELRKHTHRAQPKYLLGARIQWPQQGEWVYAEARGPRALRGVLTAHLLALGYRTAEVIPEEDWPYFWRSEVITE
jgi:hypothetical protein